MKPRIWPRIARVFLLLIAIVPLVWCAAPSPTPTPDPLFTPAPAPTNADLDIGGLGQIAIPVPATIGNSVTWTAAAFVSIGSASPATFSSTDTITVWGSSTGTEATGPAAGYVAQGWAVNGTSWNWDTSPVTWTAWPFYAVTRQSNGVMRGLNLNGNTGSPSASDGGVASAVNLLNVVGGVVNPATSDLQTLQLAQATSAAGSLASIADAGATSANQTLQLAQETTTATKATLIASTVVAPAGVVGAASASLVAGEDGTGHARALLTDGTGAVVVTGPDGGVPVSGTVTANQGGAWTVAATESGLWTVGQGTAASLANAWPFEITDGINVASVKAASTPAASSDAALVCSISPNSPLPAGANVIGVVGAMQDGAWTVTANQGGAPWSVVIAGSDGGVVQVQDVLAETYLAEIADAGATAATQALQLAQETTTASRLTAAATAPSTGLYSRVTDGTSVAAVAPASSAATSGEPALVVGLSPNSPLPAGSNTIGTVNAVESGTWSVVSTQGTSPWVVSDAQLPASLGPQANAGSLSVTPAAGATFPVSGSVSVSGTVSATQGTSPWVTSGTVTGTVTANQGTSPWVVSDAQLPASLGPQASASSLSIVPATGSTFAVTQSTSPWLVSQSGSPWGVTDTNSTPASFVKGTSPATNTGFLLKSGSCVLLGGYAFNLTGGAAYLMVFNTTTLPVNGSVPEFSTLIVSSNNAVNLTAVVPANGVTLPVGCYAVWSTTLSTGLSVTSSGASYGIYLR